MTEEKTPTPLAAWFVKSRYSQREAARDLGISEPYMSLLVSGDRTPSLELAIRISKYTGLDPSDLLGNKVA